MSLDRSFIDATRRRYNQIGAIWDAADRWHQIALAEVRATVGLLNRHHPAMRRLVIDVGSGGLPQRVPSDMYVQVDIADLRLIGQERAVCADAHHLPFENGAADCVLCVGSVANYCSLEDLVAELARIAAPGAALLLHVELTDSLEFLWRPMAGADAAQVLTHYQGNAEATWCYSLRYTRTLLDQHGFRITGRRYFHSVSALAFRFGIPPKWASYLAVLDTVLAKFPAASAIADSVILTCVRDA